MSHNKNPHKPHHLAKQILSVFAIVVFIAACTPTVKVAPPDKPIEINLNVKIEQEVRIKVERDLESAFATNPALFGVPVTPPTQQR